MDDFANEFLVKIVLALVLCAIFFRLVMRGRWIAWSHPICSACGHNLTGLPESSANCPECGGELNQVRKTAVKRPRWVSLMIALGITGVCLYVVGIYSIRYIDSLPTFALMPLHNYVPAQQELHRRFREGKLNASQQAALIDDLVVPPDTNKFQEIVNLRVNGGLSPAAWQRFAWYASEPLVSIRDQVARGDPLVIDVHPALELAVAPSLLITSATLHLEVDDQEIPVNLDPLELSDQSWRSLQAKTRYAIDLPAALVDRLSDGLHNLKIRVDATTVDITNRTRVLARRTTTTSRGFTLVAKGAPSVMLVKAASEKLKPHAPEKARPRIVVDPQAGLFNFNWVTCLPDTEHFSYSYRVIAEQDGKETALGWLMIGPGENAWIPNADADDLRGQCDLVFRPDAKAAAKHSLMITKIVDEEFTVHGALVR